MPKRAKTLIAEPQAAPKSASFQDLYSYKITAKDASRFAE